MNKRVFFTAILTALISVSSFGQGAKKYYKAGMEFYSGSKYDDAISQFTVAIGIEPSNPDNYYARGQVYEKLLKYVEAKADYEKALVFEPKNVDIMISLGAVCNKTGNYDEALRILTRATVLEKRNAKVYSEKVITLYGMELYIQALGASDTAIIIKDTPMDYYWRGKIYVSLNNTILAKREFEKAISKDKKLAEPRLELALLLIPTDTQEAMRQCNEVIKNDERNTAAYTMRSRVYKKNLDYPNAINDLSKNILIDPSNPKFYLDRGLCYQEFNQPENAINDFTKYIALVPSDPAGYAARAKSYEDISNLDKAITDYNKITVLSEFDIRARKLLKDAQTRLYELNRELAPPEISILSPAPVKDTVRIKGDLTSILISGKIKDRSKLKLFTINNEKITIAENGGENDFLTSINVNGVKTLTLKAVDDYNNEKVLNYPLLFTEIIPPKINIIAPFYQDGQVYLDDLTPNISIQGRILDDSRIRSITVGNFTASYDPNVLNPRFSVNLNVANLNKFTVVAEDIYGNRQESEYLLNRQGAELAANNPMGKTWVVFIENSSYENFASLDGPIKDVSTIQRALANYQIQRIIHMKDMTKDSMEMFFNIKLRDEVKQNHVKSLLIWYAGHGKYINDVGYWIPVDAKRDDEFTYFNINSLKAGMQGYGDVVVHTLVVSDACESGPGFYTSMRAVGEVPTCDNFQATSFKSAQVFSSAGEKLAVDNSQFAQTFANTLLNNKNACVPIETVVNTVTSAITDSKQPKPKFGRIAGLTDEHGTFFFIKK